MPRPQWVPNTDPGDLHPPMMLFWCLCVCLVLGGWLLLPTLRAAAADLWLNLFGVKARVPSRSSRPGRREAHGPRPPLPPPQVGTRPGP